MKKILQAIFLAFLCMGTLSAKNEKEKAIINKIEHFKNEIGTCNIYDLITDNFGEKDPRFYGTRNMRVVLNGVVYRGGANNVYNKFQKNDNENPLPKMALENLFAAGFSKVVYLYSKNFDSACKFIGTGSNSKTLKYTQNTLSNDEQIHQFLELVYNNLNDPEEGPIYIHCWNGWHQSGYASALILMQFCGYTNEQALNYWKKCAAGNLSKYKHIEKAILKFEPYKDLKISSNIEKQICACSDIEKM